MQLGRQRTELERDLVELTERAKQLAGQMLAAAKKHDASGVHDLTWQMADVEHKLEETAFILALVQEGSRFPAFG
jgi:hypothetical protein